MKLLVFFGVFIYGKTKGLIKLPPPHPFKATGPNERERLY